MQPIGLEELTERAGLLTRIDRKYLVRTDDLDHVLDTLPGTARVLQIDDRRQFSYRSVYFDTADLLAYRLAALRRRRRFKLRTRSYLDSGLHLLEVKTRGPRGTTVKQRVPYSGDGERLVRQDRAVAYAALVQTGASAPASADALQPTLITNYHRVTLFLPRSRSRVTIDTELTWTLPDGSGERQLAGCAVVETKCPGPAAEMDRALWAHQHRPCSISKFGTGLAALRPDLPAHRWHPVLNRHLKDKEPIS
ncbi:MAG TPA: polyphosphate polymerase domain-containing protein [Microlunatus sp.]|nr:polyphosphate polymerase domain-containing protein [Microlunatus sp.]